MLIGVGFSSYSTLPVFLLYFVFYVAHKLAHKISGA